MTKKGTLIAVEGIDGSGKTTLAKKLHNTLTSQNHHAILTREPGGCPLGDHVRGMLHAKQFPICPKAEFLLFAAARAEHFETVIIPALNEGTIVICDRLSDSSKAYQGYGRGVKLEEIEHVNRWAMGGYAADVVLYLRLPVDQAFKRIYKRNEPLTAFESEHYEFWERVANGFDSMFADQKNVMRLDATKEPALLVNEIVAYLAQNNIL